MSPFWVRWTVTIHYDHLGKAKFEVLVIELFITKEASNKPAENRDRRLKFNTDTIEHF